MRHGKKHNHLGRQRGHRVALLRNLSISLVEYKRINTTVAKAKALRVFLEPLITKSKTNSTHSRRTVFSNLQNKEAVKELFENISVKVFDRPGGYLRIVRTGVRKGDGAETAMIEFVDYNEAYSAGSISGAKKSRRSRRGKKSGAAAAVVAAAPDTQSNEEE